MGNITAVLLFICLGSLEQECPWGAPNVNDGIPDGGHDRHDYGSLPEYLPIPCFINTNYGQNNVRPPENFEINALKANLNAWTNISNCRLAFSYQGFSLGPFTSYMGQVDFRNSNIPFYPRYISKNNTYYLTGFYNSQSRGPDYADTYYEIGHTLGHSIGCSSEPGDYAWPHGEDHSHGNQSNNTMQAYHPEGNERPVAVIKSVTPTAGYPPFTVTLDASASLDLDGTIHKYWIDFGDGSSPVISTNPMISHTYTALPSSGSSYRIILKVCDDKNGIDYYNNIKGNYYLYALYSPDTTAPTTPSGLYAQVGDNQVTLRWNFSYDVTNPITYVVYRKSNFSNTFEERASTQETYFVDNLVSNAVSYSYYLVAKDYWGNASQPSLQVSVLPKAASPQPPILEPISNQTVVEGKTLTFSVHALDLNADEVFLTYENLDNVQGNFSWNWQWIQGGQGATGTFSVTPNIGKNGTYRLCFTATDAGGLASSQIVYLTIDSTLAISAIYGDTNGWYGIQRSHRAIIENRGVVNVQGCNASVYLSKDTTLDSSDILVYVANFDLSIGVSLVIQYSFAIPTNWSVNKVYVIVKAEGPQISTISNNRAVGLTQWPENVDGSKDANGNDLIDFIDIMLVVDGFSKGGNPGSLQWNSSADVWNTQAMQPGKDNQIDFMDISRVVAAFVGQVAAPTSSVPDVNNDGIVNGADIGIVVDAVFFQKPHPNADVNRDGSINLDDITIVHNSLGKKTSKVVTATSE